MGRMTPPPAEASGGATLAAVADRHRAAQRDRYMNCGSDRQRLRDQAERWLAGHPQFASVDGRPCVFAIEMVLELRSLHGGGVTIAMVERAWRQRLARLEGQR